MIDAYEVGIQLALQDGVSAGLEVIGRELAEVDRAVAASNAGLVALMQTAQSAVKAVAAAAGTRVQAPAQPTGEAAPQGDAGPALQSPTAPQEVTVSAPVSLTAEPARVVFGAAPRAERGDAGVVSGGDAQARVAAPIGDTTPAAAPTPDREAVRDTAEPKAAPVIESISMAPVMQQINAAAFPADTRSGVSGSHQEAAGTRVMMATLPIAPALAPARQAPPMQASVAQAIAPQARRETVVRDTGGKDGVSLSMPVNVAAPQAPATAGLLGSQEVGAPTRGSRSLDRGAAPQPETRERGEGGGGTVMLDGRLVGYWLTEQMARDASRPPGGTSFFDPRQSPAWTPSGAL